MGKNKVAEDEAAKASNQSSTNGLCGFRKGSRPFKVFNGVFLGLSLIFFHK
jgi:hypothetical protein